MGNLESGVVYSRSSKQVRFNQATIGLDQQVEWKPVYLFSLSDAKQHLPFPHYSKNFLLNAPS